METININGKEYTENEFSQLAYKKHTLSCCVGEGYGFDEFLSTVFDELNSGFPRQQPEPPTLRPMSELLESQTFNFVAEIERKDNGYKFHECMERNGYLVQGSHRDFTFFKTDNYENEDFKILGWLYVLPKLNEIKPC
jgi:hypothetical protein